MAPSREHRSILRAARLAKVAPSTPFIIPGGDKVLFPWAGMSFGGAF
jgi:hypothetical protein